jgi:hypothetical protein
VGDFCMQGMLGGTGTGDLPLPLILSLALPGLGILFLPLTGRGGGRMGWGEEGGEEGDVPWTLPPLCWVRRGFDGAGVGRESPQSPAPWESWWVEHVGLIRPGSRVRPNPGPAGPGPGDGPRGMGVGEKVGEANGDGGRAKGGGAPASSEVPSSSPSSSSSSPSSSLSTKALKAPPTIWGIGGGATGDHRGKEESLCKGDSTGRGEVRGRDWESRELGKGGGRGRGVEKLGKEESRDIYRQSKDPLF